MTSTIHQQEQKVFVSWPELLLSQKVECLPNAVADLTTKNQRHSVRDNVLHTEITLKRIRWCSVVVCGGQHDKELGYWIVPSMWRFYVVADGIACSCPRDWRDGTNLSSILFRGAFAMLSDHKVKAL